MRKGMPKKQRERHMHRMKNQWLEQNPRQLVRQKVEKERQQD